MAPSSEAARRRRRLYPGVAVAFVIAVGTTIAGLMTDRRDRDSATPGVQTSARLDPLSYDPAADDELTARATAGYSHVLYAKSPGGAFATARRVDRYRKDVEAAAGSSGGVVDADTLEALVFLESGGRPDAVALDGDPVNAAGLTQIVAQTGQGLLGMDIDLARSRALTKAARTARARGRPAAARRALDARRRIDARFVPRKALDATVRYLRKARDTLGRDDLALVSYHMGIGNLQAVVSDYGGDARPPYVRLFFDSTPLRHAAAYRRLSSLGDDSSTYYWRVLAAKALMRLWRDDRSKFARTDELQTNKASAEEVLHPPDRTKLFDDPGAVRAARDDGTLAALPTRPADLGFRLDSRFGAEAPKLGAKPELYRALRPQALTLARWLGRRVQRISGVRTPLVMTSAVRDRRYQELLIGSNPEATSGYSLHTAGYAFDVLRRYGSRSQAVAFQFLLDRLQALNLIAWVREPAAIHITAADDAGRLSP
ncbi:MAG: hypothetical protein QOI91_2625 [Solirubrobacteraceae bacterium]|jgi:hypothetical protein|nr:hypothetical protein [Solirubrobacteraceae bacterium]